MSILEHLNKNNLHHAYLIEGARDEITPQILEFLKDLGVETLGNPDFIHINLDSFKMEDARNLKSLTSDKGFSNEKNAKKIFLISANSFLLEAQNSLLKIFEEVIPNTHFFVIVPDTNNLLKTFISRFYLITPKSNLESSNKEVLNFIKMPLKDRLDFIKELLVEIDEEDDEGNEIIALNSSRSKALKFLNALESVLYQKMSKTLFDMGFFEHFFKVRETLRMPGSSTKTLMESVALVVPSF